MDVIISTLSNSSSFESWYLLNCERFHFDFSHCFGNIYSNQSSFFYPAYLQNEKIDVVSTLELVWILHFFPLQINWYVKGEKLLLSSSLFHPTSPWSSCEQRPMPALPVRSSRDALWLRHVYRPSNPLLLQAFAHTFFFDLCVYLPVSCSKKAFVYKFISVSQNDR